MQVSSGLCSGLCNQGSKLRNATAACRGGCLAFDTNFHPATVTSTITIHHTE